MDSLRSWPVRQKEQEELWVGRDEGEVTVRLQEDLSENYVLHAC